MKREQIELGWVDIPVAYPTFSKKNKIILCDNLIDKLLTYIDKELEHAPYINRITFLNEVLDSSLQSNVDMECYEVAQVIYDCKKRLNDT
jgi:hypothetical protein